MRPEEIMWPEEIMPAAPKRIMHAEEIMTVEISFRRRYPKGLGFTQEVDRP